MKKFEAIEEVLGVLYWDAEVCGGNHSPTVDSIYEMFDNLDAPTEEIMRHVECNVTQFMYHHEGDVNCFHSIDALICHFEQVINDVLKGHFE